VSKEEALEYLKLKKIDDKQATQVYDLVGGRMVHLLMIADGLAKKGSLQGMHIVCYMINSVWSHYFYSYTTATL
jgi:hypothetical protein